MMGETTKMLVAVGLGAFVALAGSAVDFTWTGRGGDGKWTNPRNWDVGAGYPMQKADVARFAADADVTLDTGRTIVLDHLVVTQGKVTVSGTDGSALRTAAVPAAKGADGLVVGSDRAISERATLVLNVPLDCGASRMDKWWGGSLVLRSSLTSSLDGGYGFIFGSGWNALTGNARVSMPHAVLGLGNGAPNLRGTVSGLEIADAAKVEVGGLNLGVRVGVGERVEVRQTGARSEVRVDGGLTIGKQGLSGICNVYRLESGLLTAGSVVLGDPSSDRFILAGGTFLATQDMTLPPETVFEGEPKIGAAEDCRLMLVKWPDGARRLVVVGSGEVVLGKGFVRKGEISVQGGKVVDRTSDLIEAGNRLQVFWDDALIDAKLTTARRMVHQPEYAGVAMKHDTWCEGDGCDFHNILKDEDEKGTLYRMYYLGWAFDDQASAKNVTIRPCGIHVCYAESRDGLTWTKPALGLWPKDAPPEKRQNNILLGPCCYRFGWDNFMVFKDGNPKCPKGERYKAVARIEGSFADGTTDGGKTPGLACFLSADGIHWRTGWLLTREGLFDSLNLAFWDEVRKEYRCYFRGNHLVTADRNGDTVMRDVRVMKSRDFKRWSAPRLIDFGKDAEDYSLYTSVIQPYPRAPHLYVGFPSRYVERKQWTKNYDRLPGVENRRYRSSRSPRHGLVVTDCVFIMSHDGFAFHREDDAFMTPGPENPRNWVYGDCYPAYGLVLTPGRRPGADPVYSLYVFEGHWGGGSEDLLRYTIRQDGFVSRHAPYSGAKVVTKPFTFAGDRMLLNFSTSARGGLHVTLRGADGRSIRSCELFGDKVDREVDFEGGRVSEFRGKPVTLEFEMRDADVYSFRFD